MPPGAGEAVHRQVREVAQRAVVGVQRGQRGDALQADEDVARAVAVDLDGKGRALQAEGGEQLGRAAEVLPGGDRLLHAAGHHLAVLALQGEGHGAHPGLQEQPVLVGLGAQGDGGAQQRVAGERQFVDRGEDADARVAVLLRAEHEGALRQVHLPRHALHALAAEVVAVEEHRHRVALQRFAGEGVYHDISVHGLSWLRAAARPARGAAGRR